MKKKAPLTLLTFYKFVDIINPEEEVARHKIFCEGIGMKGRIFIGEEGINATATCNPGQLMAYKMYLDNSPYFKDIPDIDTKAVIVDQEQFPKMIVRYRSEIVALGKKYSADEIKEAMYKISPEEFKKIMDNDSQDHVILDMRNNYEFKLGHFKGAIPAGTISFRDWEIQMDAFKKKYAGKEIIMYCTGGIRCEKVAVMLKESGLDGVKQLDGGVVKYVNSINDGNWLGNLYTFDGRVSAKVGNNETHKVISRCHYTDEPAEEYFNCRYSFCNAQIIAKPKEFRKHNGFCCQECVEKALGDLMVRNVKFDPMDYKAERLKIKLDPEVKEEVEREVRAHILSRVKDVEFKHIHPPVEELLPL